MKARIKVGALALVVALALASCGGGNDSATNLSTATGQSAPLTRIAAPNNGDWTEIIGQTPEGGFRMGNPDAPVKLVEYASITCHVCAEFEEAGGETLRDRYVRSGQVSWEYRPYMLFPTDPGIFMLLRCQGPAAFFRLAEQLYATQTEWTSRVQALPPEQLQQLQNLTPGEQAAALVRAAGLDQFFRQRGMPEARMSTCLADNENLQQLSAITQRGSSEDGVQGTPTFIINGERQEVSRWSALEPLLRTAIGD